MQQAMKEGVYTEGFGGVLDVHGRCLSLFVSSFVSCCCVASKKLPPLFFPEFLRRRIAFIPWFRSQRVLSNRQSFEVAKM